VNLRPAGPALGPALILLASLVAGLPACGWADDLVASAVAAPPGGYSATALYNAGNAHARQGHTGLAVLDYERARLLEPNDPDIRANLELVRKAAGLPPAPASWLENHGRLADPNWLYWAGVIGVALLGVGTTLTRFLARRRAGLLAVALGLPLLAAAVCDAVATWPLMHEAVVLRAAPVRVSPADSGDASFTLREGQVVQVSDRYRGFTLVRSDPEREGWVATADLAPVT
jgi:hypothetical protein